MDSTGSAAWIGHCGLCPGMVMSRLKQQQSFTKGQLYGRQWRKAKKAFLVDNPLCVMCQKAGQLIAATVVDHIKPHKGNISLFWDKSNWQPLCQTHHNSTKQAFEKSGKILGNDKHGQPIDPDHHWNQPRKK